MKNKTYIAPKIKANILNATIVGIIAGMLLLFFILLITIQASKSGDVGFLRLHVKTPLLFLVYLLPIGFGWICRYLSIVFLMKIKNLEDVIEDKDANISRNAMFAKSIGEGDFSTGSITEKDKSDLLTRSLLLMRRNLIKNKEKEQDQNWISNGKDLISNILRAHTDISKLAYEVLENLLNYIDIVQGSFYLWDEESKTIKNLATYAYNRKRYVNQEFKIGQGLIGQAAFEKDIIYRTEIPEDYVSITSGLIGDKKPCSILIVPLISEENLQGLIEIASIKDEIDEKTISFVRELGAIIGQTLFNLKVNQKTAQLLHDAQVLTEELQENEEKLQQNAEEMRMTHEELEKTNTELESKVDEVEQSKQRLHSMLENASEVISIFDEEGNVLYESPSAEKIFGYTPEEIIGENSYERVDKSSEQQVKNAFKELIKHPEKPVIFEFLYKKKGGEKIWVETTGRNMLHNPAIKGMIFNTRDITLSKLAEKDRRLKSQMQALSENSMDIIIRIDPKGQFYYVNPVVERYFKLNPSDMIKKNLEEVKIENSIKKHLNYEVKRIIKSLKKHESELIIPTKEGNRVMNLNAIPEFNENKELETILFVAHDITEMKKIEHEIKQKNQKVTESINYAERIQNSILPDTNLIRKYLPESFIFFQPRDVVSGDFPWFYRNEEVIYIAAVDCTGHGVPGALLSFIGYFLLNNIVSKHTDYNASEILDELNFRVKQTLKQDMYGSDTRDGMDIALCKISLKDKSMDFSGAHRPMYLLKGNELIEYKGDRNSIGGIYQRKKPDVKFTNHNIKFNKGEKCFIFTDGLPDQYSSIHKNKYQTGRIKKEIIKNHNMSIEEYSKFFVDQFNKWKGNYKQIDDVLVIGFELV
jgi:PAS domain S-box-containing protein